MLRLDEKNYYTNEADIEYMSVSQFKSFVGTIKYGGCEYRTMQKMNGKWHDSPNKAMMVGSYVDSWMDGTLDAFKEENPSIFTAKGELRAEFKQADDIIERIKRDDYFMKYISGEHQTIMTGELFGANWKIKMDSYFPKTAIVDLKTMASITDATWFMGQKYDFVRACGYDIQLAVYQKIVELNTGDKLPCFIAAVTKETPSDMQIIHINQDYLDRALTYVEANMPRVLEVKNGEDAPIRCEKCDCCRYTRRLTAPIELEDLLA